MTIKLPILDTVYNESKEQFVMVPSIATIEPINWADVDRGTYINLVGGGRIVCVYPVDVIDRMLKEQANDHLAIISAYFINQVKTTQTRKRTRKK